MITQLLETKLTIPPARPELVPRPRLLARLNAGLRSHRKLTLISAPAGFGKTTLLSAWVNERGDEALTRPLTWLSLDAGDNDPVRFWTYLTEALRNLPEFPAAPDLPEIGIGDEPYLTALLNRMGAMPAPAVLVLDDVHRVDSMDVYNALDFLLDHLPPVLHLVIATRADPPLPIARLRGRGQLVELRQADLRFTCEEATAFLNQNLGLVLAPEDVAALAERTEGWIAGLQMAAVSMQGRDDLGAFIRAFAGSHRYVMDYLMEEVLQRQSAEVQRFLIHTSILEQLGADLCDAVLPEGDAGRSQALLEYLEQANLFVTPLDEQRIWYRYHRLFADLLKRQLSQRYPERAPDLHRRASEWYEVHERLPDSIDHALAASDFERAAGLVARAAEGLLMRSEVVTLRTWLDALPDPVLRHHPGLCATRAWLLLLSGKSLRVVEAQIEGLDAEAQESGKVKAARALIALFEGKIDRVLTLTEQARECLNETDGFWYTIARWLWGLLQLSEEDWRNEETQALRRLIRSQLRSENVLLAVLGLCNLGEMRAKQGRLRDAEGLFTQALGKATNAQGERIPIGGEPLIWLGDLARERNDLSLAERYLTQGIERISDWGRIAAIDGYTALARLRQAQGKPEAAYEALEQAGELAILFDATDVDDAMVAMHHARIDALEDDFAAVARWRVSQGLNALDPRDLELDATIRLHLRKYEITVLCLAWIREGRPGDALTLLDPLLSWVAAKGRWRLGIEILAQQAAAHWMRGEAPQALTALERALRRAEPEGYVRLFVEPGQPMAQLLYEAARRGLFPDYAGRLLNAFPDRSWSDKPAQRRQALIEPLSDREQEVLVAIADGLSNQEIARRLYISERTVKWHASNIYGKLQVDNRTEAVAKARTLGILAP